MPERPIQPEINREHDWPLSRLPDLMARRVQEVLLVSSAYDAFILEEDGLLTELIFSEYLDLGLSHAPQVTRASSAEEALQLIRTRSFDLVITMLRLGDMNVSVFRRTVRELRPDLPVVLLIANELELAPLGERRELSGIDGLFVWNGEPRIFLAIIKLLEDRWNVEADTETGGVGVVILVEDSVRYRSTLLPIMYTELVRQTRSVMAEGLNRMQKLLRLRARPKILVAETFEQGMELYQLYREYIFGVITDVSFLREGRPDPQAGIEFIRQIRRDNPDVPALLQSSDPDNRRLAEALQTGFLHKRSPTLHADVREFMLRNFGFGDFVFRTPDGSEVARAADLRSMARVLAEVPAESLEFHARRNHFSNWLRARGEFLLARRLRPRKVSEFSDLEALRRYLILAFEEAVRLNRRGVVAEFSRERFDPGVGFARIGAGSLGGKARGLAFVNALLARHPLDPHFPGVRVHVPRCVVIGTTVFDEFLELNQLRPAALRELEDAQIMQAFLAAGLPADVRDDLRTFLETADYPLAVRSSALLEDSPDYPFAGVYETLMLPNNEADAEARLEQLCRAVRLVYASTFYRSAQRYLGTTPHPAESQKMAVLVQQIVGLQHGQYFYPNFSGVVRSYNFYPFGQMRPEEGVACVVLGLGRMVVEGGPSLRFCPAHPHVLPQLGLGREFLDVSQRDFYAIDLTRQLEVSASQRRDPVVRLELDAAERHGTLAPLGSVWSEENECFYDGIYREGVRAVTFAHVLKSDLFPLAEVLRHLLDLGRQGMGGPVEIEFAVNLTRKPAEFAVLQMRPYGAGREDRPVELEEPPSGQVLCYSEQALGNGILGGICDIVYVRPETFDAARTREIAAELSAVNDELRSARRPFLLIGPGRWGSSNPWLGIPVAWADISAARIIVETALDHQTEGGRGKSQGFAPDPSCGSHFFHNLTASGTAYLTIHPRGGRGWIDWPWLEAQPAQGGGRFIRHVRLPQPLEARIDGRSSRGAVLKCSTRSEMS